MYFTAKSSNFLAYLTITISTTNHLITTTTKWAQGATNLISTKEYYGHRNPTSTSNFQLVDNF